MEYIFYGFLVGDSNDNVKVFNLADLREVFIAEYKKLKKSHSHLPRDVYKEAFVNDLVISYFYVKNKYFYDEMLDNLVKKLSTKAWIEKVIYYAIYYNFIEQEKAVEAKQVMEKYKSEDDFFHGCNDSKDEFISSLVDATQI